MLAPSPLEPTNSLCRGKARASANRGQHGHGGDQTDARHLDQPGDLRSPGRAGGPAQQFGIDLAEGGLHLIEQRQALAHLEALDGRKRQALPPEPLLLGKGCPAGSGQVVGLQEALHLMANPGALLPQALTLSQQRTEFTHGRRRYPDCWDEARRQEASEMEGIAGIGLDPARGSSLHFARVRHRD
jgi:hypothetical protein